MLMPYTMEDSVRELARQLRQLRAAGLPRNPDMIVFPPLDMPKPILHLPVECGTYTEVKLVCQRCGCVVTHMVREAGFKRDSEMGLTTCRDCRAGDPAPERAEGFI